ncbi:MAG: hypothetical protein J6U12_00240 [Candidatus Methanomethylophilaceae archaeon]|nr:hypothetical protein [Candidatus Methanomethylophilaceae archaeon]
MMKTSTIVMIAGGALSVVSLYLACGTFATFGVDYSAWDLKEAFDSGSGILNLLARYAPTFIFVFGICMIFEPIIGMFKPDLYNNRFGYWMIFNGAVLLFFSIILMIATNDLTGIDIAFGEYLLLIASVVAIASAYMNLKDIA